MTIVNRSNSISALEDQIYSLQYPAHIKCSKSFSYLLSNPANSCLFGEPNPEILKGLTAHDLIAKDSLSNEYVDDVAMLDRKIVSGESLVVDTRYIKVHSGVLRYQDMFKTPLRNDHGKIYGILTYSIERTMEVNLLELYSIYSNYFKSRKVAAINMMGYLGLTKFFRETATYCEIYILLSMVYTGGERKRIADLVGLSVKTVQNHIDSLKKKLNKHVNLEMLIYKIRQPRGTFSNNETH